MDLFYPSKKLLDYGYVSIGGCTANVYFDDVRIENWDTEAPPALEEEEPEESSSDSSSEEAVQSSSASTEENKGASGGCNNTASIAAIGMMTLAAGFVLGNKKEDAE